MPLLTKDYLFKANPLIILPSAFILIKQILIITNFSKASKVL